jgi:hypothetical protein
VRLRYETKMGWLTLAGVLTLFAMALGPELGLLWSVRRAEGLLFAGVLVLALGLIFARFFVLAGVRVEEQGLTIERRGLPEVFFPWDGLRVSERSGEKRGAGGWMLETEGKEEAFFLPEKGLVGKERLQEEFRKRCQGGAKRVPSVE